MQKEKEKYSLWQRIGIYLYNIFSNDMNVRIHGVPAGTIDTRYKNLKILQIIAQNFKYVHKRNTHKYMS